MSRILRILIATLLSLAFSVSVWGREGNENQQVRDVIYKEIGGHIKGDPDQIMSCYAPGFVWYWIGGEKDSVYCSVKLVGLDSLRAIYAEPRRKSPTPPSDGKNAFREVRHVHVKDDRAVAVSYHGFISPDSTAQETIINDYQSVWMLAKIKGEWKITGLIARVTGNYQVWKWASE